MDNENALKSIVKTINITPKLKNMLEGWDKIILFKIETETYLIKTKMGIGSIERGFTEIADVVIDMDIETFEEIVKGDITPIKAKMKGKLKSTGHLTDILRLAFIWNNALKIMNNDSLQ